MEHELRLATHQQRAGGQDDVSPSKLPQITTFAVISSLAAEEAAAAAAAATATAV